MPSLRLAPASTEDYRVLAEKCLPRSLFDYVDGGANREVTLAQNTADFDALKMRQRVMRDVSKIDTSIELFGETWTMPVALAPVGLAGMVARRAEVQAKRATDAFGIPFCLSTASICSLEEVAAVSEQRFWFQLYMLRDRGAVRELLQRAKHVGVSTLIFTVDLAVAGVRYRDVRNGMRGGIGLWGRLRSGMLLYLSHPRWLVDVAILGGPHSFGSLAEYVPKAMTPADFRDWVDSQFDASVTWKDIEWLRSIWDGNLLIKGVLDPEDALAASRAGADAVIISNHGGRQLDGVSSSIAMLPRVIEACGDDMEILMDGGVRNGLDVTRALALGAKATLIGRPWVYATAARGEAGLESLLQSFKSEMGVSMALTGTTRVADLTPEILDIATA